MDLDCPGFEDGGYVTLGVAPVPGELRQAPGDFLVEEIPLYPPTGSGEHLYVRLRKTGISTLEAVRRIAAALRIRENTVGYAGLKDSQAVAIQHFSLWGSSREAVMALEIRGVEILDATPHGSKIRIGHLKGNRFRVRLKGAGAASLDAAAEALERLGRRGVPNVYMGQRFGRHADTHELGRAVLFEDHERLVALLTRFDDSDGPAGPEAAAAVEARDFGRALRALGGGFVAQKAVLGAMASGAGAKAAAMAVPRREKQLYLSAYQSWLFNRVLARRMPDIDGLEKGDLAVKHRNGAFFTVEDPEAERPRIGTFEISASGPVFGHAAPLASGRWGAVEREIMESAGALPERWRLGGGLSQKGERRPLRFQLSEHAVEREGDDLVFGFALQKGAYATAVFREILKRQPAGPASPETSPEASRTQR